MNIFLLKSNNVFFILIIMIRINFLLFIIIIEKWIHVFPLVIYKRVRLSYILVYILCQFSAEFHHRLGESLISHTGKGHIQ